MKINVHAGHNPDGKPACGAVGVIKESTEARAIKNLVIAKLKSLGHEVYDCTVEDGTSQSDVLKKIVSKCNAHTVDLDVGIHLNCGVGDKNGNGKTTGTEVLVRNISNKSAPYATKIVNEISNLGFKNRGVKERTNLYVLNQTKAPALLIESFFCDDKDDVDLYKKVGVDAFANAIVKGITGQTIAIKNDVNGDGKVTAEDALDILKQTTGIKLNTSGKNANDALEVLKQVAGTSTAKSTTTNTPVSNSTSTTTTYTKTQFIKDVQSAIGAKVDGVAGNETLSKTITVSKSKNNKHKVIKPIQKYLNTLGYNCGTADGIAGTKFDTALKAYQSKWMSKPDGEATAKCTTWKKLLGLA